MSVEVLNLTALPKHAAGHTSLTRAFCVLRVTYLCPSVEGKSWCIFNIQLKYTLVQGCLVPVLGLGRSKHLDTSGCVRPPPPLRSSHQAFRPQKNHDSKAPGWPQTREIAAERVVLPWSTWPMVPMFTWGWRVEQALIERRALFHVLYDNGREMKRKPTIGGTVLGTQIL